MDNLREVNEKLEKHAERIESLEKHTLVADSKIDNLCDKLESLTSVLKWVGMSFTGAFITLAIFVIEKHIS